MTRNDTIILIAACAILIIGGFFVLNNSFTDSASRDESLSVNESSLLNPDDVTIPRLERAGDQTASSSATSTVSLTQVPYTGIRSEANVFLFILGMAVWTAGLSYIIVRRKYLSTK